jgi:hypothetical protein
MKTYRVLLLLGLAPAIAGCATMNGTTGVEEDFGASARSLISAQTANPSTLTAPSDAPVVGVDPDYANNVVEAMRADVPKGEKVKQPIVMQVGGWSN